MEFPKVTNYNKIIVGGKIPSGFVKVAATPNNMVIEHDIVVSDDSRGVQWAQMRAPVKYAEKMGWKVFRHVSKFKPPKPQPTFSKELRERLKDLQVDLFPEFYEAIIKRITRLHLKHGGTK